VVRRLGEQPPQGEQPIEPRHSEVHRQGAPLRLADVGSASKSDRTWSHDAIRSILRHSRADGRLKTLVLLHVCPCAGLGRAPHPVFVFWSYFGPGPSRHRLRPLNRLGSELGGFVCLSWNGRTWPLFHDGTQPWCVLLLASRDSSSHLHFRCLACLLCCTTAPSPADSSARRSAQVCYL
jgi:hypothetical protein